MMCVALTIASLIITCDNQLLTGVHMHHGTNAVGMIFRKIFVRTRACPI